MNEPITPGDDLFFQVSASDLGPLFIDRFRISPQAASPLRDLLDGYTPGERQLSADGTEIAGRKDAETLARIVEDPILAIVTQSGGGPAPVLRSVTVHNPPHHKDAFITVTPSFEGAVLFQWHESAWFFLARWLDLVATKTEEAAQNLIPPPTTPLEMMFTLHAVDLFRRVALENQLDPEAHPVSGAVTPEFFASTLRSSIQSRDSRWLLPAYLLMMPDTGLENASLDDVEQLEALSRRQFLLPAPEPDGQDLLVFGEASRSMGTEFLHLWWGGSGFQAMAKRSRGTKPLASGFFATTALTHHFFVHEEDEANSACINHQPLTRSELETRMAKLMAGLLEEAIQTAERAKRSRSRKTTPPPQTAAEPPPPPSAEQRFCSACGKAQVEGARFCNQCGHPMESS